MKKFNTRIKQKSSSIEKIQEENSGKENKLGDKQKMYHFEIEQFLKDRNYYIGGDDIAFITDTRRNPQLNHIKFNPYDSSYDMWDREGHHYHFSAIPYSEAKEKGLVKRKEDWER